MKTKVILRLNIKDSRIQDVKALRLENGINGEILVVEDIPDEINITADCTVSMKKRFENNGFYIIVMHGDKKIGIIDPRGDNSPKMSAGYELRRVSGAVFSFNIYKINKE